MNSTGHQYHLKICLIFSILKDQLIYFILISDLSNVKKYLNLISNISYLIYIVLFQVISHLEKNFHVPSIFLYNLIFAYVLSRSVMSDSLRLHRLAHGDSPGENIGMGCYALLQGILPTQGLNSSLQHCR